MVRVVGFSRRKTGHFHLVPGHILRGVLLCPERPFTVFAHDIRPFGALPNEKGQRSF